MKKLIYLLFLSLVQTLGADGQNCEILGQNKAKGHSMMYRPFIDMDSLVDPHFTPPPTETNTEKERLLFYIHGLGGDEFAWATAMDAVDIGTPDGTFPGRKTKNRTMTYTTGDIPMTVCASKVEAKIDDVQSALQFKQEDIEHTMLICHSQGGIVGRAMNLRAETAPHLRYYGGMAFFTSSLGGAQILQSARDGLGEDMTLWASDLLLRPVIKEQLTGVFWRFPLTFIGEILTDKLTNIVSSTLVQVAGQIVSGLANQTQTDAYVPGSAYLTELKDYETNPAREFKTHRIDFTSEEPDEGFLIWRTINYFANPPPQYDYFQANADDGPGTWKNNVDDIQQEYDKKRVEMYSKQLDLNCHTWLGYLLFWDICDEYHNAEHLFIGATDFFDGVNDKWKIIIGARKSEVRNQCKVNLYSEDYYLTQTCLQSFYFPEITDQNSCGQKAQELFDNPPSEYSCQDMLVGYSSDIESYTTMVDSPSDGVVTLESQAAINDKTMPTQFLKNSSHMQIRNDNNLKWSLLNLFDGSLPNSQREEFRNSREWFMTEKR